MAEYASNAKGNAALATGIIGTSLGALAGAGGLDNVLGIRPNAPADSGYRPVTRYEIQQMPGPAGHVQAMKDAPGRGHFFIPPVNVLAALDALVRIRRIRAGALCG